MLRSALWKEFDVYCLTVNLRLKNYSGDLQGEAQQFADWLLAVGNGTLCAASSPDDLDEPSWIEIPDDLLIKYDRDPVDAIACDIYEDMIANLGDRSYFRQRAIVTPTNDCVHVINQHILAMVPFAPKAQLSSDSIARGAAEAVNVDLLYPDELLNNFKFNGVPNHELCLKIGCPVMMLRNLNPSERLCNGTRLIVTKLAT